MRVKILTVLVLILSLTFVSAAVAAVAIPGSQRMMAPGWFGFQEIDHNVFAPPNMDETKRKIALNSIREAERLVSQFYGYKTSRPIIVICPSNSCDSAFGKQGARGAAYGKRIVRLNDKGINVTIAAHELAHTALKTHVGEWYALIGAVPAWFDEGLAVLLSRDERFKDPVRDTVLEDLRRNSNWWDWSGLVKRHGWRDTYGAAFLMVKSLEAEVGRQCLLSILSGAADGVRFDNALAIVRNWRDQQGDCRA